jgi:Gram-negative bacterial TonB protein C-terminal
MSGLATKMAAEARSGEKSPELLVAWNSDSSWWTSLKAVCSRSRLPVLRASTYFHSPDVSNAPVAGGSFTASFLMHCALILLIFYLPQALPANVQAFDSAPARSEKIYYRVPLLDSLQTLPRIAPAGPGARPGTGSKPDQLPVLGSTASHSNLTIVSKPAAPDNNRQTIYQRSSPPDLRIPVEVKLPNMVLGDPSPALKSPVNVDPNTARPTQMDRRLAPEAAPNLAPEAPKPPLVSYLDPSVSQPKLAIPVAGAAKPTMKSGNGGATGATNGGVAAPGDGNDLLVVGVDPAPAGSVIALGPGNRWGEFSISPAGGQPGSPGGSPSGVAGGGSGGKGAGGDGSTGVGSGGGGGGGGNSGTGGAVSISGSGGGEAHGALPSALIAAMVYPVPSAVLSKLRKNSLVVSAGPIGGGGLGVYRALNCGKIYTVFLPMPGKNWTMQYCPKADAGQKAAPEQPSTVIHMEAPIVPPEPDAESRYDFQRVPVPIEKGSKLIVLRGTLLADGTVSGLEIFQGVVPAMDEAARLAFGKWKFQPPMRSGKPVAVDILVGIPPTLPNTTEK